VNRRLANGCTGALIAAVIPVGFAGWAAFVNPWFMDELGSYLLFMVAPWLALGGFFGALVRGGGDWKARSHLLAFLGLMGLMLGTYFRPTPGAVSTKLLIFGVDGATWDVFDGLSLPAFESVKKNGAWGVLRSSEPMFSPLLWTSMAPGEVPDQHGIHGFRTQATDCRSGRFWDVASDKGWSVGLYKWLVTWPPAPLSAGGFVVPSWLAGQPDTWPTELSFIKEIELSRRLKRKRVEQVRPTWRLVLSGVRHGLRWSSLRKGAAWMVRERLTDVVPAERAWHLQLLRVWMDRDVFVAQLHRHEPGLATFTTYATDALAHTHWELMEACNDGGDCPPWGRAVPDAYQQADVVLGEIVALLGDDAHVLVVSDHGFRAFSEEDRGRNFVPTTERLRERIRAEVGPVDVARLGHKLTVSFDAEVVSETALVGWLDALTQASTGNSFYRWEAIPNGVGALGLTLRDERMDAQRLASDAVGGEPISNYASLTAPYTGEHDMDGIVLAAGPAVPLGVLESDASLLDVAPTALGLLGLPASKEMTGRVLWGDELPRVDSYDHLSPAEAASSKRPDVQADVNTEQLRALGYIE